MSASGLWAVVPVKNLEGAKQRLAPVLAPAERRGLFRAMVEDVLRAVCAAPSLAGVLVVTCDAGVAALARAAGARPIAEPGNRGHSEAVAFGARHLISMGARGLLTVPADVPLVSVADVEAVLAAHRPAPAVTIAPSHDEHGSNALACSPPDVLVFGFGDDSFRPHLAQARRLGVEPAVVRRPALALDVDTPEDLRRFARTPSATLAYDYLRRNGILPRLATPGRQTDEAPPP